MRLRHAAVFMNAGSYVTRPPSSWPILIWRRSVARMAPSAIGSSYVLPVRLSVIVSVSAIKRKVAVVSSFSVFAGVRGWYWIAGDPVAAVCPPRQVLVATALAAERPPPRLHGTPAAQDAQRG